jgi:hypothetical protein
MLPNVGSVARLLTIGKEMSIEKAFGGSTAAPATVAETSRRPALAVDKENAPTRQSGAAAKRGIRRERLPEPPTPYEVIKHEA